MFLCFFMDVAVIQRRQDCAVLRSAAFQMDQLANLHSPAFSNVLNRCLVTLHFTCQSRKPRRYLKFHAVEAIPNVQVYHVATTELHRFLAL